MRAKSDNSDAAEDIPKHPAIQPLLPLLYVAWSDGELSPKEIEAFQHKLPQEFLASPEAQQFVATWLRPERPPEGGQMRALLQAVRDGRQARDMSGEISAAVSQIETIVGVSTVEMAGLLAGVGHEPPLDQPDPVINIEPLRKILDGEHAALRQRMRDLLSKPEFALQYGLTASAYRKQVLAWCERLAAEGLGSLAYPHEQGGRGDRVQAAVVFEMLAFHDTSLLIKYGVQFGLFGGSINRLGTQRHREAYLRKVGTLELLGCYAMTELGHGSNVAAIETIATYDSDKDSFIVSTPHLGARKEFIGNAACDARMATVFAQLYVAGECHGVHALLVPIRDEAGNPLPGLRIGDSGIKMGLNGVDNGWLQFDNVAVPRENLLSRYAEVDEHGRYASAIASPSKRFFTTLGALVSGRLSLALASLSSAKVGLAIAIRYGHQRRQFGPPGAPESKILDYLTHQRRLLPHLATAYALDAALKWVSARLANPPAPDQRELEGLVAGMKAYSSWFALEALQNSRECCGGQGYLAVNRIGPLRADTEIFVTFEGDNTVLMQLVAKGLLTDYRRQFEDLRAFTVARHLAGLAETAISEFNPVATHSTKRDHLRSSKFQLAAFSQREHHLLATVARRLRHRIANGMSSHDAFHECQDHLVAVARAHVERVVAERFTEASATAEPSIRTTLKAACDLFALSRLEADRAWFLERGYFAPAKSKAIRAQVTALCGELRPHAPALTEAFGIPAGLLPDLPATLER